MTLELAAGLVLALASAAALNWGFFAQHAAASALPPRSLRRPLASLRVLFAHRGWLVGFLAGIGGWVLYVAALALAPLSLVHATSAGGIGLLALLVSRAEGGGLAPGERRGVAGSVLGLALLAASVARERRPRRERLARSRRRVGRSFRRGRGARRRAPRPRPGGRGRARDRGRYVLLGG